VGPLLLEEATHGNGVCQIEFGVGAQQEPMKALLP
jgi:hypothetical protein